MNEQEIAALLRVVRALCPAQKFDEFTPDAWLLVLDEIAFDDARAALKPLALAQPFIAPTDIAKHVRKVRGERIDAADNTAHVAPNSVQGVTYGEEMRAVRRAQAEGHLSTAEAAFAYEAWGGSLHLAYQRGQLPALSGPGAAPLPAARPKAVEAAIARTFQQVPRGDERPAPPAGAAPDAGDPQLAAACPVCQAEPGEMCVVPGTATVRLDPHPQRREAGRSAA